jgi:hypothetical protein
MDASGLDERTLRMRDYVIHTWGQSHGEDFGHNLCKSMNEANRPKVGDVFGPIFLRQKGDVGGVEPIKVFLVKASKKVYDVNQICFDCFPTSLEEGTVEPI